ncbi:MAG: hypothetical protein AB2L22_09375 [Syntrophales bacterium]
MGTPRWWIRIIVIALGSAFFLAFGIESLTAAYRLRNAHEFIVYFFSSSFIILISLVGLLYPILQIYTFYRTVKGGPHEE